MSELFKRQIVMKMQGATTSGAQHLCNSCASSIRRQGLNAREDLQICMAIAQNTGGRRGVIDGAIAQCSMYYPKNLPALHELQEIAWEIVTKGTRGQVGFITPEDRRNAGIGFSPAAPYGVPPR